jgi:hypothetical protein
MRKQDKDLWDEAGKLAAVPLLPKEEPWRLSESSNLSLVQGDADSCLWQELGKILSGEGRS